MTRQRRVQKKEEVDDNAERIHACSICKRRFKRTEHCVRHERAHAKVKPYNCRFCERSYGRRDLVVRHEKTLHEDEWSKAQALIKKNSTYSDGLPLSRRKRVSSSVSRHDEYNSPVSPPEILHPGRGASGNSPHCSNQTDASPIPLEIEESNFSRNALNAQANCVYSCPLTPGTHETNIDRLGETCIQDSALTGVSHIPEQYYVEEQYPNQYNHHKAEQSTGTSRETNFIPVDPNLFESPNAKPLLPAWSSASGCMEILSIWPEINALQSSPEYHRTYGNGFEKGKLYRHAQGQQAIDGDISCLRSLSSLVQPPTSKMIIDDHVMGLLLLNTTTSAHLHGESNIADTCLLQRSLDQFFLHFNSLIPIIHPQTFDTKVTFAPLILAMCSIGAYQLPNHQLSRKLMHIASERFEHSRNEKPASATFPSQHICELQCQVLLIYIRSMLGDASTASMAIERIGIFHREFPPLKAWLVNNREQNSGGSWKPWVEYETTKRLLFSMFIMSSLLTTAYDIAPCMSTAQVLGLELPCADALWEALDERQWFDLQNPTTSQLPRLELQDVINPLTSGQRTQGMDKLQSALDLSNFAITAVAHALNIYVWNLKQCIPCSPPSFSGNADNIIEGELRAICTQQAETSIARCCQLLANRLSETTKEDHKRRLLDRLVVFKSYALLRSSFLGTFATDTTRSIRVALLSADDSVTIQSACNEYAKQLWHRDQFVDNAAMKLFTDMLAPLYFWKGGCHAESERGMEGLHGTIEHSISVFDTVLFFTKWLSGIELRYQGPPNGQPEYEIMDGASELIGERVDGRTALAASLTEAFASLLAGDSSSGVAARMRSILLNLADAYEDIFQIERNLAR
ncbi:hypothetical protein GX51_04074 [Blastomyces parvus]|uniref:C2H2-type domain-containing protein n=1 Tax=Blastomyces parvus TaxID=2060905 RepID=A0A2B7X3N2_9EURO|nr:hypothetical protein GX51_04074 [Blastomyces parvus]